MLTQTSGFAAPHDPQRSMLAVATLSALAATLIVAAWIGLGMLLVGSS